MSAAKRKILCACAFLGIILSKEPNFVAKERCYRNVLYYYYSFMCSMPYVQSAMFLCLSLFRYIY